MEESGDWDLQAVVRGCSGGSTTAAAERSDLFSSFSFSNQELEKDMCFCFPDMFDTQTALEELEELCKPFFPKSANQPQNQKPKENWMIPMSPSCSSGVPLLQPKQGQRPLPQTTRSKRRKIQQKKVVCHVPADGLSADMWAWRKYGQKPIKGSPHPRGYYKCSSSKGCLARKQVERSRTDPNVFMITYTGEHNHPMPTHRNSLAGSTRHKFPPPPAATTTTSQQQPTSLSPTTPLTEQEGELEEEEEEGMLLVSDMEVLGEDDMLFLGLDELQHTNCAA